MFKLVRPCKSCPFRKGNGPTFRLAKERLLEIFGAVAFQCHGTVDYGNWNDPDKRSGDHPQQCAGLMSILHRYNCPNQIMQLGERMGGFDPAKLDHREVYKNKAAVIAAHTKSIA